MTNVNRCESAVSVAGLGRGRVFARRKEKAQKRRWGGGGSVALGLRGNELSLSKGELAVCRGGQQRKRTEKRGGGGGRKRGE